MTCEEILASAKEMSREELMSEVKELLDNVEKDLTLNPSLEEPEDPRLIYAHRLGVAQAQKNMALLTINAFRKRLK